MLAERLASSHSNVTSKCHLSIVNTKCSYVNTHLGHPAASVDEGRFVEIDTHGGEKVKGESFSAGRRGGDLTSVVEGEGEAEGEGVEEGVAALKLGSAPVRQHACETLA